MAERVFLHVGCPKTGTTFLQQVLWSQRDLALEQGLLLPLTGLFDHFQAMVEVRDLHNRHVVEHGIWQHMLEEIEAYAGTALVSHELFAGTTAEQAEEAVEALEPAEVHVVVTARDLARQLPSEWQEHVKHRAETSFHDFVAAVVQFDGVDSQDEDEDESEDEDEARARWFWTAQDPPAILERWHGRLPAERLHVVTVPRGGGRPDELWRRFAGLVGLEPDSFRLDHIPANPSLRAEQVMLLRELNARLEDRLLGPGDYPSTVKDLLAHEVLAGQPGTGFALPPDRLAWAQTRSEQIVAELQKLDCDVVGDLDDLVPRSHESGEAHADPDNVDPLAVHEAAVAALADLMERRGRLDKALRAASREADEQRVRAEAEQQRADDQQARADRLDAELARRRSQPVRQMVIDSSETRPALMKARVAYWRTVNLLRRLGGRA